MERNIAFFQELSKKLNTPPSIRSNFKSTLFSQQLQRTLPAITTLNIMLYIKPESEASNIVPGIVLLYTQFY